MKLSKKVYLIESDGDASVLVGVDVAVVERKLGAGVVYEFSWFDTMRERKMLADRVRRKDETLVFQRVPEEGAGVYFLKPLTLELYREKVMPRMRVQREFASEEEMVAALVASGEE